MKILLLGADENSLNLIGSTNAYYDLVGFYNVNFCNPKMNKKNITDIMVQDYDMIVFPKTGVVNQQIKSLYEPTSIPLPHTFLQPVRPQTILLTFRSTSNLETMAHLANTQVFSLEPTIYSVRMQEVLNSRVRYTNKKSLRRIEVLGISQKDMTNRLNHIFSKLQVNHVIAQYQPETRLNMTTFLTTIPAIQDQLQAIHPIADINYYCSKEQQSELVQQSVIQLYEQKRCHKQPASAYQKTKRGYL